MNTPRAGDARHDTVREQVGAYALDQLSGGERLAVAAHVRDCPSCREELDLLRAMAGPLAALDPDDIPLPRDPATDPDAPTAQGFAAVRARIRAEAAQESARGAGPHADGGDGGGIGNGGEVGDDTAGDRVVALRPRPRRSRVLLAAASAVVVFVLGTGIGTLLGPLGGSGDPFEPVAVQALDPEIDASAGVVPHTWGVEVKLTASGFRSGETYRATVRDGAGRTVSAGEFIGTGTEEMECNLNSSILREDAAGFTITDASGRPVLESSI